MSYQSKLTALAMAASALFSGNVLASQATERLAQVQADYNAKIAELQREGAQIGDNRPSQVGAAIGVDCNVKWGFQSISFDLPEVRMGRQKWVYDLPEVFWGITNIGPIKLHLPQFKMGRHESVLDVPEFSMKRQEIKMHLPEFTCNDANAQLRTMERRGKQLEARGQAIAQQMERDLKIAQADVVREQRDAALKQVDDAIAGMHAFVSEVQGRKGNAGGMQAKLAELRTQRERMIEVFEKTLRDLS